jgi:trigger factor
MQTSVQVVSEIEVRIEVELPATAVNRELDRQLGEFGKKARVRGFRPGKAPKDLVKKSFAQEIATEATRKLINDSFKDAAEKVGDRMVGEPQVEPGIAKHGEPLKYAIRAQVKPQVALHSWQQIEVGVAPAVVDPAEVDKRLKAMQDRHKERVPVEDRSSDTGDIIVIETTGFVNGARDKRLDMKAFEVTLGSGQTIPGFEDELMGLATGDEKGFDITFPADYGAPGLAGQAARFECVVTGLFREDAPALDDDFAQDVGFGDMEALRADVVGKVQAEADKRRQDEAERKVLSVVLERNAFPIPPAMVETYATERARYFLRMFRAQGMSDDQAMRFVEQNWEMFKSIGSFEVKKALVLEAIARQEKLDIEDEELSGTIVERIKEHGEKAGKVYERQEMRDALRQELLEKKALALLMASSTLVNEAPAPAQDAADAG